MGSVEAQMFVGTSCPECANETTREGDLIKTLMHFAGSVALAGVLVGAKLIAQTSARVAAKSSVADPMEIPLWPGVAPGSEGWTCRIAR